MYHLGATAVSLNDACQSVRSYGVANRKRGKVGRFTEQTEKWFEQGDSLVDVPTEELPAELVGYHPEQTWRPRITQVAIAVVSLGCAIGLIAYFSS